MADILRHHGTEYLEKYDKHILPSHKKVMRHITSCRTSEMGGQKYLCKACDKFHYSYHSCRDRHCTKCQSDRIDQWLEKQFELLLPVPYFMATITVPEGSRPVFRSHQKIMYHILFKASAEALMTLALDRRFLGADIGLMGILQTWTRMLAYHPHIHFLIPGGGMKDERWKYAKPNLLVHVKPLSRMIRRIFRELLKQTDLYELVPQSVWKKEWVCHIEPVGSGENTLKYLAPYIYRGPISDSNILSVQNDRVAFRYKDQEDKTFKTCTLEALEFLRRFLQHVLPRGFVRVRYFGFLATKKRADLTFIKERIGKRFSCKKRSYPEKPQRVMTCPDCGHVLIFICEIPKLRGPP
jgi:predicted RNA-binding Zn-ribbon protein involved in translation (DUF1610 family)